MIIRKKNTVTKTENRTATRFAKEPQSDYAAIWYPQGLSSPVEVHDESLGGLGIFVEDGDEYPVGLELGVVYAGSLLRCYVRHSQPQPDGRALIGLECEQVSPEE